LTGLAILGFITLPIRITTIYGGLPAHPLFVHVPVILIPSTVIAAIVLMVRTDWFARYGIALAVVSIGAMSSIFLTMQAGGALDAALHLRGRAAHLISDHSQAPHVLAFIYVVFTPVLIITFAAQRISGGMGTGLGLVDRALSPRGRVLRSARRADRALVGRRSDGLSRRRSRRKGGVGRDASRPLRRRSSTAPRAVSRPAARTSIAHVAVGRLRSGR
jgi:hypothetical protein